MVGKRKGQAAMEYLMTYGWAILVIIIVLALLLYLGVFTPALPEVCKAAAPGWTCSSFRLAASNGKITFNLSPSLQGVTVTEARCTQESGLVIGAGDALGANVVIQPGQQGTISTLQCRDSSGTAIASFTTGQQYRGVINIQYYYTSEGSANTRQMQFNLVALASS